MSNRTEIKGNIVDLFNRKIFYGILSIENSKISNIKYISDENLSEIYIMPGFIDSHVHVESSLLVPFEYGKVALKNGVIAAVCDPHEIANVVGVDGVKFMIENGKNSDFKFFFGVPSCVPATSIETSGAILSKDEIEFLFKNEEVYLLSEMMNFPGVINQDPDVIAKLDIAKKYNKPIDGHAPGVSGTNLKKYVTAGIQTDHECTFLEEAIEKIKVGMKILIREGSAAKNLNALKPLFDLYPDMVMLCTDDIHAEDLKYNHLNKTVKKLLDDGYDFFNVLRATSVNVVNHYNINVGILRLNDYADFLLIDNKKDLNILEVFINGKRISSNTIVQAEIEIINNFKAERINCNDIEVKTRSISINVINIINKEIITGKIKHFIDRSSKVVKIEPDIDILKIVVVNRYKKAQPAVGFVKGFGLKSGAVATSIAHDSHNIIAIGVDDYNICRAVNEIIDIKGGICYLNSNEKLLLELPIAGLMSNKGFEFVSERYQNIESAIRNNGSKLDSPIMNLSFLSLLVIPELKISDRGVFDFNTFSYIDLFE